MRGGALPPTLLLAALALVLSRSSRQGQLLGASLSLLAGAAFSLVPTPANWTETVFLGGWMSVALTAALIHWPGGPGRALAVAIGLNAGLWSGLLIARAGRPIDLATASLALLLLAPGAWIESRKWTIALKVAASWLIAIAVLAAVLPLVPTPGYVADHMN